MSTQYLIALAAVSAVLATGLYFWIKRKDKLTDPVEILVRQAVKLRWKQTAKVERDGEGAAWTQQSIRLVRGNEEAIIWNKDATVTLVRVHAPPTFNNFLEAEKWIAQNPNTNDDSVDREIVYLREIEKFIIRHGHFFDLLEVEATDEKLFGLLFNFKKAGHAAKEDPVIVAALILDALMYYESDRNRALDVLEKMAGKIGCKA